MPTPLFVGLIIAGALALAVGILAAISRLRYRRSLMATVVAAYLRATTRHISDDEVRKGIKDLPKKNGVPYALPKSVRYRVPVRERTFENMQVFYFNDGAASDTAVLYLHGGGYVRQPRWHHIKFLHKLAEESGHTVAAAIYPKAPDHGPIEAYRILTDLYAELCATYRRVIVMGDSSGGGLALGLCQEFALQGIGQPDELILLSPWVDVGLNNPKLPEYEKKDPLIRASAEKIWGKAWAGDLSVKDPRVSPLYGDMSGLRSVWLFVGNRELLYPDDKSAYEKMLSCGVNVRWIEGEGMNHVYPIYPIPEAKRARRQIINIINGEENEREKSFD